MRLIKICFVLLATLSIYSCDGDLEVSENPINRPSYEVANASLDVRSWSDFDRLKNAIAKSIASQGGVYARTSSSLTNYLWGDGDHRILVSEFDDVEIDGIDLWSAISSQFSEEDLALFGDLSLVCSSYPSLTIALPHWTTILEGIEGEALDNYVIVPCLRDAPGVSVGYSLEDGSLLNINQDVAYEFIPIQIKEAEDLIPYDDHFETQNGDPLLETLFPHTIACPEVAQALDQFSMLVECSAYKLLDILAYRAYLREFCTMPVSEEICDNGIDDDEDGLVDEEDPDCMETLVEICNNGIDDDADGLIDGNDPDCVMGGEICTNGTDDDGDGLVDGYDPDCYPGVEVCNNNFDDDGDGLVDGDDPDCACVQRCERDCVDEINVIEGFSLANYTAFRALDNQVGGEDVLSMHFTFVHSILCDNPRESGGCPSRHWERVFFGTFHEYFDLEVYRSNSLPNSLRSVLVAHVPVPAQNDVWILAYPKYYDIPVYASSQEVNAEAPYLPYTQENHWDGDVYGNVVSFAVHEHDEVIVKATTTESITVNTSSETSLGLKFPIFEKEGEFDFETNAVYNVQKTSSHTYEIEAEKDVSLGDQASVYCDANYDLPDGRRGINKSTGAINIHLAHIIR